MYTVNTHNEHYVFSTEIRLLSCELCTICITTESQFMDTLKEKSIFSFLVENATFFPRYDSKYTFRTPREKKRTEKIFVLFTFIETFSNVFTQFALYNRHRHKF